MNNKKPPRPPPKKVQTATKEHIYEILQEQKRAREAAKGNGKGDKKN